MRDVAPDRIRAAARSPLVPAGAAVVVALLPGAISALAAAALALVASVLALKRRAFALAGCAAALAVVSVVPIARPVRSGPDALAHATARLTATWRELVGSLVDAAQPPPPAGSDFSWLASRSAGLGPASGAALFGPDAVAPIAWSGWTTPLSPAERAQLLARLDPGPAVVVLRRGLTVRLLVARRDPGPERLVVAIERPLPAEPDLGPLAAGLGPSVRALIRWEALGEGLRAPLENRDDEEDATYWSMVPLMAGTDVAGRASLGVDGPETVATARDRTRRRAVVVLVALAASLCALARRAPRIALLVARAAAIGALPGPAAWIASGSSLPWILPEGVPWPIARLVATPADAAATGALLIALAATLAPRRSRALFYAGAALAAAGTLLAARATVLFALAPRELLIPGASAGDALLVLSLAALPVTGLFVALRARPGVRFAFLWAAAGGAMLAGLAQVSMIDAAARRLGETRVLPELAGRRMLWNGAIESTLRLAFAAPGELVPERDAIDLWWNSALGRAGLASGIWKFAADGTLEDSFLFAIPPVSPGDGDDLAPRGAVVDGQPMRGPSRVERGFLGGTSELVMADVERPAGGRWVVAVLDAPGNLGGGLTGASAPGASRGAPTSPFLVPRLAWFDARGHRTASDLPGDLAPPRTAPLAPRWRRVSLGGRAAQVLDIPDAAAPRGAGSISVVFLRPGLLQRAALVTDRAAAALLAALLLTATSVAAARPDRAQRLVREWLPRPFTHFREQATVFLVAAGLVPLLVLGVAGRVAAERQARRQLGDEATRAAHVARNLLEDYMRLAGTGTAGLTDAVAAWLSRALGDDLFVWTQGQLIAASRPDLVRAGLWPSRLSGTTWDTVAHGLAPLRLEAAPQGAQPLATVVHGAFRAPDGSTGVLSVPLQRAGQRIEESLADVDRALLLSASLLVLSTVLLVARATRRLVDPLAALEKTATRIASGDYSAPAPVRGYAETDTLFEATRAMAQSLDAQREALERRRLAIETLIARMPIAVLAFDGNGVVLAANPRAAELTGAEPGAPLRPGPGAGDDDPLLAAILREARAREEAREVVESNAGGRRRHLAVTGVALPGLDESSTARLVIVEDLSDTIRSERLTAWAEMARRIAHEIKNPLTPISLVVEHVRSLRAADDPRFDEVLDRALSTVADQVRVLRETAREFSDYARLLEARPEPLDLARALRDWVGPYTIAPPAGVDVVLSGPDELPPFEGDPRLLRRAVVNLVDNALAAVEGGGRVEVRWSADETSVAVLVADDGPGIDPGLLPALFETGATTRETGSGLGLPIALSAAHAHGGRIDVETSPGHGARFTIVLPRGPAATVSSAARGPIRSA